MQPQTIPVIIHPKTTPATKVPIVSADDAFISPPTISIVEPRNPRNYIPKFQAKFYVAKEEPDSPFQGFVQLYRQGFGHHVVGLQDPGTDRAHSEDTRAITKRDRYSSVTYDATWYAD